MIAVVNIFAVSMRYFLVSKAGGLLVSKEAGFLVFFPVIGPVVNGHHSRLPFALTFVWVAYLTQEHIK